jgi:tetratricopeptide (TPR) repeat protein
MRRPANDIKTACQRIGSPGRSWGAGAPERVAPLLRTASFASGAAVILACAAPAALGWSREEILRHDACAAKAESRPEEAYEDGLIWQNEGGGSAARHCVALALIGLNRTVDAAEKLDVLAASKDIPDARTRAMMYAQAGNVWLLERNAAKAVASLDAAITADPSSADSYIDRARAHALAAAWQKAADDLSVALGKRPSDGLALRLRAGAYLELRQLDAAEADIRALLIEHPGDVDGLVLRGRLREARAGRPAG